MKEFELYEPATMEEACALLARFRGRARPMAGGTDLLVQMKGGSLQPKAVVNLKRIKGLDRIRFSRREGLRIGTLVTWTQLMESEPVSRHYPLLRRAAETMGAVQIRNVGTLAGNVCHASPAANGPIALLVYDAQALVRGPGGERISPVEKLFAGPQRNSLKSGEILAELRLPPPPEGARGAYYKFSLRKAMDLATVGVAALVSTENGTFKDVRLALGAVGPKPFRVRRAERLLSGRPVDERLMKEAAEVAVKESSPISDIRGSRQYRIELIRELTFRALRETSGIGI